MGIFSESNFGDLSDRIDFRSEQELEELYDSFLSLVLALEAEDRYGPRHDCRLEFSAKASAILSVNKKPSDA